MQTTKINRRPKIDLFAYENTSLFVTSKWSYSEQAVELANLPKVVLLAAEKLANKYAGKDVNPGVFEKVDGFKFWIVTKTWHETWTNITLVDW